MMRSIANISLVISLLYLPWWLGALVVVFSCFAVQDFYEVLLYGIAFDALYGSSFGFHGFVYVGSLFTLIIFLLASLLRDHLSW